jgi:predicted TIM-barrel fold metal-dependent hydrolase
VVADFSIYTQPKVDCHCHVLDPKGFPYAEDVRYRPAGQETGTAKYFGQVLDAYGAQHALLVGPNSGYGIDNRCLLDAIAAGGGRFKGIAVLPNDAGSARLQDLKAGGIVGVAFNFALHGLEHYLAGGHSVVPLWRRLADAGLFVQVQAHESQLATLAPLLTDCGANVLVDHCGRPAVSEGISGAGFAALLGLAKNGRTSVKLSGFAKFSKQAYPFPDTAIFTTALLDAFGSSHCIWASDWPYLMAPSRLDYGTLLQLFAQAVPNAAMRHDILWNTPMRLFGFSTT